MALLALCACQEPLDLPDRPSAVQPPQLAGLAPPAAFAGANVRVRGAALAGPRDSISVRFGGAQPVRPEAVAEDGAWVDARVPDDAASGDVRVTTPAGEAVLEKAFTFSGLGRLRHGRVARELDLRPVFAALPLQPSGTTLLQTWLYPLLVVQPDGAVLPLNREGGGVAATFAGGHGLVVAQESPLPGCDGHSLRVFRDLASVRDLCLPPSGLAWADALAVDDAGTHVLALSDEAAWLVDVAAPENTRRWASNGKYWSCPAWLGGSRFVLAEETLLRAVDWQDGTLQPAVPVPQSGQATRIWVAARGGRIAVSADLRILLLDAPAWPPTLRAAFSSFGAEGSLPAFSDDLRRLLVSDQQRGRVVVFDLTAGDEPVVVSAVELGDAATWPAPGRLGTFAVGLVGGWATLSQETGALLERRWIDAGLEQPHRVRLSTGATALATLSRTFDHIFFVDEAGIQLLQWADAGGAEELAAVPEPAVTRLYLRAGPKVWRLACADETSDCAADGWAWEAPAVPNPGRPIRMALVPDGTALALSFRAPDGETLAVLDTSRPPASAPPMLALGDRLIALAAAEGRVAAVTARRRLVVDVPATLGGGAVALVHDEPVAVSPTSLPPSRLVGGPGYFLELGVAEELRSLRMHAAADGRLVAEQAVSPYVETSGIGAAMRLESWQLSPGGRRSWWITGAMGERIVSMEVDPDTGAASRAEAPILLKGITALIPSLDGERLLAVKREGGVLELE